MSENHSDLSPHPNIEGLTLFTVEPAPHEHQVHEHEAYSVIGLTSGAKQFHHQGETHTVSAFEIAIANPGELHGCGPIDNQPWSHRTWYLSQTLVEEISKSLGCNTALKLTSPVIRDQTSATALIKAHESCNNEQELLESQSIAMDALLELFAKHSTTQEVDYEEDVGNIPKRMKIYANWLEKNIGTVVELSDLAEQAGVKRNQVIKDFKSAKGVTPGNYFRLMRLKHAKELIRSGADLAQTSLQAGFADQSHFTRSFRLAFGITPNQFKKITDETSGNAVM